MHLDKLPDLNDKLLIIYVANNVLVKLSCLPDSLEKLWCNKNFLQELPLLPMNLTVIECNDNFITKIGTLPPKLEQLKIFNNNLESLPELPDTLHWLECHHNPIKELPKLPENMRYLLVNHTSLETIPNIPICLHELNISNTNVNSLPDIYHKNIKLFNARYSKLSKLPSFTILDHYVNTDVNYYTVTPLHDKICKDFNGNVYKYIYHLREEQSKAVQTISKWYLDKSYDPQYVNCRKRVMEKYDDEFNENKKGKLD